MSNNPNQKKESKSINPESEHFLKNEVNYLDRSLTRKVQVFQNLIGMVYGRGKVNIIELSEELHLEINVDRDLDGQTYFVISLPSDEPLDSLSDDQLILANERLASAENVLKNLIRKKSEEYNYHEKIKKKHCEEKINRKHFEKSNTLRRRFLGQSNQLSKEDLLKQAKDNKKKAQMKNPYYLLSISENDEDEDDSVPDLHP